MSNEITLLEIQKQTLSALTLARDAIQEIFDANLQKGDLASQTIKALFHYQAGRSQAISFLTGYGFIWDAEIVLRSYYEASAKILLFCFSSPEERPSIVSEFWVGCSNISSRRRATKAGYAQAVFNHDDPSAAVFAMLQDGSVFDLENKVSKAQRREIERRWSFSEIVKRLGKLSPRGRSLENIRSFLHIYATASHLIHADHAALDLLADRQLRDPNELLALEASHVARVWSDQFNIAWFCADALAYYFDYQSPLAPALADANDILRKLNLPLQNAFNESQKDFYSAYVQRDEEH